MIDEQRIGRGHLVFYIDDSSKFPRIVHGVIEAMGLERTTVVVHGEDIGVAFVYESWHDKDLKKAMGDCIIRRQRILDAMLAKVSL